MILAFNYFQNQNFDILENAAMFATQVYNVILDTNSLEDWEKETIYDQILSEKVFDV